MTNYLFNLPENIISTIYEIDSTYRDKFKNEIHHEMMHYFWNKFKTEFISRDIFKDDLVFVKKMNFIFEFIFKNKFKYTSTPSDNIIIDYINEKDNYTDNESTLDISIIFDKYKFEGTVYTKDQYNNDSGIDELFQNIGYYTKTVFKNEELILVSLFRR